MEKWQKDFLDMIQTVADEVENFLLEVTEIVDTFFEVTEEITEQVQNTFVNEIDQYLQELAEPFLEAYWEDEVEQSFPYSVEPTTEQNPACLGCRHYHGQVYGGNLLVCGMHPYGWEDENCPDWEQQDL
jgi:hypothetical protein